MHAQPCLLREGNGGTTDSLHVLQPLHSRGRCDI
jgi:hypothetical protein